MRQDHSLQALQHISGGAILILVALTLTLAPALINVLPGAIQLVAIVVSTILGLVGSYVLFGGIYLMLRSRAYR